MGEPRRLRSGFHVLPHPLVPEAVLGGVRRAARASPLRVRGRAGRFAGGGVCVRADRGDVALPRGRGGDRLHWSSRLTRAPGGVREGALGSPPCKGGLGGGRPLATSG